MISIDVQDDADFWEKAEKTVGVLAGFCDEGFGAAYADIPADGRKDAAYADGGITVSGKEDVGYHGGRCGFAVGSGNRDGCLIVAHDLAQKLRSGEHGKPELFCAGEFRVFGWMAAVYTTTSTSSLILEARCP